MKINEIGFLPPLYQPVINMETIEKPESEIKLTKQEIKEQQAILPSVNENQFKPAAAGAILTSIVLILANL